MSIETNKTPSIKSHTQSLVTSNKQSHKSHSTRSGKHTVYSHSKSGKSTTSRSTSYRSSASSALRQRLCEAAANVVTQKAELEAQMATSKLESEIQERQQKIAETNMRASLFAEEKRVEIFKQALEEEEGDVHSDLMQLPTTRAPILEEILKNHVDVEGPARVSTPPHQDVELPNLSTATLDPQLATDLAQSFSDAVNMSKMPMLEPTIFSGDPIQYQKWEGSFDSFVNRRKLTPKEKLQYLEQYLDGAARDAVSGNCLLSSESDYNDARVVLKKRYGNNYIITQAYRERLENWPKIGNRDIAGLRKLADFLRLCCAATRDIPQLKILREVSEVKKMMAKLPDWMSRRWLRVVSNYSEKEGNTEMTPPFEDFVKFVCDESNVQDHPVNTAGPTTGSAVPSTKTVRNLAVQQKPQARDPCLVCHKTNHDITHCFFLQKRPKPQQEEFIRDNKLCYSCLKPNHMTRDCKNKATCRECKKEHPTSLHPSKQQQSPRATTEASSQSATTESTPDVTTVAHHILNTDKQSASCMIVPVEVFSANSTGSTTTYAMLDSQSDTTFITEDLLAGLNTASEPARLKLSTMTSKDKTIISRKVKNLQIRGLGQTTVVALPPAYTRPFIPVNRDHIPTPDTAKLWPHLSPIAAELHERSDIDIGLLIGYNCPHALAPRQVVTGNCSEPFAIKTDLGWSLVGNTGTPEDEDSIGVSHRILTKEIPELENSAQPKKVVSFECKRQIKEIINLMDRDFTDLSSEPPISLEDRKFLTLMEEKIYQNATGFYTMPLPFRQKPPENNSLQVATRRLNLLQRKFNKDPAYKEQYHQFMEDVIERGDAELVPSDELETPTSWYIPHFGVFHPKKPGKIRVVFDCSAKVGGTCLNDYLMQGPDLLNTLLGILLRFRVNKIAMMCDIEKMFHQFRVSPDDQNYLRFLWTDKDGEARAYKMKVHLFGASSSPSCATYGLRHAAKQCQADETVGRDFILNNFYVDDGLISTDTAEEAIQLYHQATAILQRANVRLHKFVANNREVMNAIPDSERNAKTISMDFSKDPLPIERALGITWCVETDTFQYPANHETKPTTRRGILSAISSIYDPLGFLSPFVLKGKIILQKMCTQKADWDDPLSPDLKPQWELWLKSLTDLKGLNIPRWIQPTDFGSIRRKELHHFCDASTSGYGACSYLKLINHDGKSHCCLLIAKSKVAPIKTVTVPRMELQAAVLAANLSEVLHRELNLTVDQEYYWSDSRVVLGYINNESKKFHTFVANRVQKIHDKTQSECWNHIPSEENPADIASRGLYVNDLMSSNWFNGPERLRQSATEVTSESFDLVPGDEEVKSTVHRTTAKELKNTKGITENLEKFSNWQSAVTAFTMLQRLAKKRKKQSILDNISERKQTEIFLIRQLQATRYAEEISSLKNNSLIKTTSSISKLDPILDHENVLRVGGRMKLGTDLTLEEKHPIIIPSKTHLSTLLVRHYHEKISHQGRGMTTARIRMAGYWIVGCSKEVSSTIHKCVVCRKLRFCTQHQKMSDLPPERLSQTPPFTYVGADCFGPFTVKDGRKETKRYGLIFTCLYSRAIHLEVLEDMTTDSFLNSLRNLIAIRGPIRQLRTDRGTNFIGAQREMTKMLENMDNSVKKFYQENSCEFVTNVPHASHMGGVWERMIRTARNVLQKILKDHKSQLRTSSLRTMLYEAMAIVNSRPLGTVTDTEMPLTPNLLLHMKSDVVLPPPGNIEDPDVYSRKQWIKVQALTNLFWKRWKKEYLITLQTRNKWKQKRADLKNGDFVLVKDITTPRADWPLGRVKEAIVSKDGCVRKAVVEIGDKCLTSKGKRRDPLKTLERPVTELIYVY